MVRCVPIILVLTIAAAPAQGQGQKSDENDFFELRIRPVLAGTCFPCHGGDKTRGGLRVDSRESLLRGGKRGPALVPGKPQQSLLVRALRQEGDPEIKMPPGKRLAESVVADFARWIKYEAPWPKSDVRGFREQKHWAFEPVRRVLPPRDPSGWATTALDCFIAAKLSEHGLRPVRPAEKRVLLRRVYFDLIGLPPSPTEMAHFLSDDSPVAYARVVERLLASPQYGERWGRHWMDVARYADTAGDNADYPIPEARLYRDYIIDAFNADKPYDQFVQEQIAGDILAKDGPSEKFAERVTATGFLALARRYGTGPYELWHLTMEDAIETTGRAFLGLTMRCARCHDHKFDPLTKEDYYALYGFFASTQFPWNGAEEFASMKKPREHFVPLLPPRQAAPLIENRQAKMRELETALKRDPKDKSVAAKLAHLRNTNLPADLPGAYAVAEGSPVDMYVHVRGEVGEHGPVVRRNVPRFLGGEKPIEISRGSSGRLQLAQWLTRPENPLTARVMVNRIWQHHFGRGLVATPSNFGTRGEPPTHPELLDWLAARFVIGGWSIKNVHREIVLSRTYQMASSEDATGLAVDPSNRLYWHFERRRLDAEALRDTLLLVSGRLQPGRPGAHPFPALDQWHWTQHNPFKEVYPSDRRTVYVMTQRIQRHPLLSLFDSPDANTTTDRRDTSTVPQQALFLMNNLFVREQAEGLARRLLAASADCTQRIELAHKLAWCNEAGPKEVESGTRYVEAYEKELARLGICDQQQELEAWTSYARVLLCANEFAYVD